MNSTKDVLLSICINTCATTNKLPQTPCLHMILMPADLLQGCHLNSIFFLTSKQADAHLQEEQDGVKQRGVVAQRQDWVSSQHKCKMGLPRRHAQFQYGGRAPKHSPQKQHSLSPCTRQHARDNARSRNPQRLDFVLSAVGRQINSVTHGTTMTKCRFALNVQPKGTFVNKH